MSQVVAAPAAAIAADVTGRRPVAGQIVVVLDVGAGCEATVLQHAPTGWETVSTLAAVEAGGDGIDTALAAAVIGDRLSDAPADLRWQSLGNLRTARHALATQVAVAMPMPGGQPPMIVNVAQVSEAARPVLRRAGELAATALANADLSVEQAGAVLLIGAAAHTPGAAQMVADTLGVVPRVADRPHLAAVLGAADTHGPAGAGPAEPAAGLPPLRRLLTLALPGIASLLLYAHFVLSAEFNNGTRDHPRLGYYVLASWGELAVAAVLAILCFLQAASLLAVLLEHQATSPATSTGRTSPPSRITGGIGLAVAAGLATTGLYAITGAVYFNQPVSVLLRWSLLPILPTAAAAIVVAALAWRRSPDPGGWDALLTFPASSMITAAVGILAISLWGFARLPWWMNGVTGLVGLAGGFLIGIAVACTLTRHLAGRAALAMPLVFFTTVISQSRPGILAIVYALRSPRGGAGRPGR